MSFVLAVMLLNFALVMARKNASKAGAFATSAINFGMSKIDAYRKKGIDLGRKVVTAPLNVPVKAGGLALRGTAGRGAVALNEKLGNQAWANTRLGNAVLKNTVGAVAGAKFGTKRSSSQVQKDNKKLQEEYAKKVAKQVEKDAEKAAKPDKINEFRQRLITEATRDAGIHRTDLNNIDAKIKDLEKKTKAPVEAYKSELTSVNAEIADLEMQKLDRRIVPGSDDDKALDQQIATKKARQTELNTKIANPDTTTKDHQDLAIQKKLYLDTKKKLDNTEKNIAAAEFRKTSGGKDDKGNFIPGEATDDEKKFILKSLRNDRAKELEDAVTKAKSRPAIWRAISDLTSNGGRTRDVKEAAGKKLRELAKGKKDNQSLALLQSINEKTGGAGGPDKK
jgi:hypothetical protein